MHDHPIAENLLTARLTERLRGVDNDRSEEERGQLARLMCLFSELPPPPDPIGLFPQYRELQDRFLAAVESADPETLEERFLELYCHVHGYEAPYTPEERRRVDETGGYWCHAGGLSPILKAGPFLGPHTVSGEYGAGNGLQTLLMQRLHPHARTIMVEISSRMVAAGKELQAWLGVPEGRVEWIVGDVAGVSPAQMDFIYLYRPVRPEGQGRAFYTRFAEQLAQKDGRVIVFSIADCLCSFLNEDFEVFYHDGHLTCFCRSMDTR